MKMRERQKYEDPHLLSDPSFHYPCIESKNHRKNDTYVIVCKKMTPIILKKTAITEAQRKWLSEKEASI